MSLSRLQLSTDRSKAAMLFGADISYSALSYLIVSCSGSITTLGEERELFFCYRLLVIIWFLLGRISSPSNCVILLSHSLCLPLTWFTNMAVYIHRHGIYVRLKHH